MLFCKSSARGRFIQELIQGSFFLFYQSPPWIVVKRHRTVGCGKPDGVAVQLLAMSWVLFRPGLFTGC
jgi:hypothetical protein